MKKKLLILSDLFGFPADVYRQNLSLDFDIEFFDVRELAGIDKNQSEQEVHQQFVKFGIDRAIENLEKMNAEKTAVLAFSIGGVIAWRYALKSDLVKELWAVSATRLRVEESKPRAEIHLFYGENDPYKPKPEWFEKMTISPEIIPQTGHEVYRQSDFFTMLIDKLIRQKNIS